MAENKEKEFDLDSVLKALDAICKVVSLVGDVADGVKGISRKYGFIHKQAFINYMGKEGRLVWDYILINELTFEDAETREQYSLGVSASDKKTEELFNQLVEKFGI